MYAGVPSSMPGVVSVASGGLDLDVLGHAEVQQLRRAALL